ncbi:hypothetical protein CR513_61540, partial [Mucuna pruriens]
MTSYSTIYPLVSLERFRILRELNLRKNELKLRNDFEEVVNLVGDVNLVLASGFELILKDILYEKFIFVSCLDDLGFNYTFGERKINLMLNSKIIGYGFLVDGLYKLSLASNNIPPSLVVENFGSKGSKIEEKSFMLRHKHLVILPSLIFDDLVTYVDCIRGKFAKTKKKCAIRSSDLLEIIHTNISGPLIPTICVKKQLGKMIKIVRFDCGGGCYGKYGVTSQHMGPFALYLQDCGITP